MSKRDFRKRIRSAVNDPNLKVALDRAAAAYAQARRESFEGVDFERLRTELREYKDASLRRAPELLEQFRREAERVGVQVHEAANAEEANDIALDLVRSHGARKIVKSKSMLSEEIGLNAHLLAAGLDVTETDLGEWICQLANERPSHFTAPAIHKTREEIAELFARVTNEDVGSDIPTLVELARREIRESFIEADVGISGANIAIAETGTLVIVSNEGNARLVTSLPEVHIALVGHEKLVPSIDEATAVIKLLARSGTGQKMTSYVSFITGPSRTSDIEKTLTLGCHGPRELHVIFVDNGRLRLLEDPEFREALFCVKCGACLSACPVYRSVGGHVFGHTYVGGIGAILAAFHAGLDEAEDIVNICSACGRCMSYCPVKIDIPRMILGLRRKLLEANGQPFLERVILAKVLRDPARLDSAVRLAQRAQKVFMPGGSLPFPLDHFGVVGNLPMLADKPLRERLPEVSKHKGRKRGTVAFYPGCMVNYAYTEIGEAVADVLARLGWDVLLPEGQGCCGIPALVKGDAETARELARHNVNISGFRTAEYVITACPTCAAALKGQFAALLVGEPADVRAAGELADKVHDFCEFLVKVAKVGPDNFKKRKPGAAVTYHDPCHAKHGLGIFEEPRKVLALAGYELMEMADPDACCGLAGSHSISYPEISESILKRKLESVAAAGASILATDCPGCILQLRKGVQGLSNPPTVLHTAQIVADRVSRTS